MRKLLTKYETYSQNILIIGVIWKGHSGRHPSSFQFNKAFLIVEFLNIMMKYSIKFLFELVCVN